MASNELADDQLIENNSIDHRAWGYLGKILVFAALLGAFASTVFSIQRTRQAENPFLQVTNREFSLFLWQFPEYMRANVSGKVGYLPGFKFEGNFEIESGQEDDYVSAPSEVLYLYHAWKQLLWNQGPDINADTFFTKGELVNRIRPTYGKMRQFLEKYPHYRPNYWYNFDRNYLSSLESGFYDDFIPDLEIPSFLKAAYFREGG